MARPNTPKEEKRSRYVVFRVTEKEFGQLAQLSVTTGKPAGVLIREKLFTGRFPRPAAARIDLHTYAELKKMGVNLNQLTRKANAGIIDPALLGLILRLEQRIDNFIIKIMYDRQSENR